MLNKIFHLLIVSVVVSLCSCKKFIEISPPVTQIVGSTVFESDQTANSAMLGIYSQMMNNSYPDFANGAVTLYAGLSADELSNYVLSGSQPEFYFNSLSPSNIYVKTLWSSPYSYIYSANAILEGLQKSSRVSQPTKNQLEGEAKFIRAFCHFYLVNLFGDVAYVTTTDFNSNAKVSRMLKSDVYDKIIADLKDAQNLLLGDYSYSNNERVRPNKWAATALLARTLLYKGDYANAETESTSVISNSSLYDTVPLANTFLKNNKEAIWQLMPAQGTVNTREGNRFILTSAPTFASLSAGLVNAFEPGDNRKSTWVGGITVGSSKYYYPYKYKIKTGSTLTEYYMVLRLAELYLVRAEARAHLNKIQEGLNDLNLIRHRAGLPDTTASDQTTLLSLVYHERQVELFTEWGHRWLDLKRTGRADAVLAPIKSPNWQSTDTLYPIPLFQLQNDPNMSQNPGY